MKKSLFFAAMALFAASCTCKSSEKQAADQTKTECLTTDQQKVIVAYVEVLPDKVAQYIEVTKPIIEKSRAEEGCISYTLYQDPSNPTKFIYFEEWKNQAAIDFHFNTEHFKGAGALVNALIAKPTQIKIMSVSVDTQK